MIHEKYVKVCDAETLTAEIVTAGLPHHPSPGARFYGVSVSEETTVHCFDDLTDGERTTITNTVTAHGA